MKKINDIKKCYHVKIEGKHIMVRVDYDGPYIRLATPKWLVNLLLVQKQLGYYEGRNTLKQEFNCLMH